MRKIALLTILFAALLCIGVFAVTPEQAYLAKAIATAMGDAPFVVKTAFGELLCNRMADERFPDTLPAAMLSLGMRASARASEEDLRAAAVALQNYGFSGGALYFGSWKKIKNTPLAERNGVRLYDYFFYSSQSSM